jgi:ribonuclease D
MTIITGNDQLQQLCHSLTSQSFITIDTEFLRDKTYYPRLCLIQIADDKDAYAIDCLAEHIDLSPLFAILNNEKILKVFHACRQDLEILYSFNKQMPKPIFDSQVAASVCGFGDSIGLENLAAKLLSVSIDKSSRFTDWSRRPLTAKQLDYALNDVIHLRDIYIKLNELLKENGRIGWLKEEMDELTNAKNYIIDHENIWQRLKIKSRSPKFLYMVKKLATWRELKAQQLNIPRSHMLKDDSLLEIAASAPKTLDELKKIRQINTRITASELAGEILEVIERAKDKNPIGLVEIPPYKKPVQEGSVIHMLKLLLKVKCEESKVAERMVASSKDIAEIAYLNDEVELLKIPAMHGWRYEVFGKYAADVKQGKMALKLENDQIKLIKL